MENQTTPPKEGTNTRQSKPWHDRFYEAINQAFPDAIYTRLESTGLKNTVSWTADDHRFFFSWYELTQEEINHMEAVASMENP